MACLFEAISIDVYKFASDKVPESFQVTLVQSHTTLLKQIASWMNKTPDEILIHGEKLENIVNNFNSVSFWHCSFQSFKHDYESGFLSIVNFNGRLAIVTIFNVFYFILLLINLGNLVLVKM